MGLHDLLVRVAEAGLALQSVDGSFPAGRNGPWAERVTPARNTGHWLITLCKAVALTGESRFRRAAHRAISYLQSPALRPMGYTYQHRFKPADDLCNGLIGQAWTIESLISGYELTGDEGLFQLAQQVFLHHPFDERLGLWRIREVDGTELGLCTTLNQQIWFAACVARLARHGSRRAASRAERFRSRLAAYLRFGRGGYIGHVLFTWILGFRQPQRIVGEILNRTWRRRAQHELAVGYHSFILAGLARLLPEPIPDELAPLAGRVGQVIPAAVSEAEEMENNKYAYGYNPVGFEMALAAERFSSSSPTVASQWVQRQLDLCFDAGGWLMTRRSPDPDTLSARFYEAAELPDLAVYVDRHGDR